MTRMTRMLNGNSGGSCTYGECGSLCSPDPGATDYCCDGHSKTSDDYTMNQYLTFGPIDSTTDSLAGPDAPSIDGRLSATEYDHFVGPMPMYNGGKTLADAGDHVGEAFIGYDHTHHIVCVVAKLTEDYLDFTRHCDGSNCPGYGANTTADPRTVIDTAICEIDNTADGVTDENTWVRFGAANKAPKATKHNAIAFAYLEHDIYEDDSQNDWKYGEY